MTGQMLVSQAKRMCESTYKAPGCKKNGPASLFKKWREGVCVNNLDREESVHNVDSSKQLTVTLHPSIENWCKHR